MSYIVCDYAYVIVCDYAYVIVYAYVCVDVDAYVCVRMGIRKRVENAVGMDLCTMLTYAIRVLKNKRAYRNIRVDI